MKEAHASVESRKRGSWLALLGLAVFGIAGSAGAVPFDLYITPEPIGGAQGYVLRPVQIVTTADVVAKLPYKALTSIVEIEAVPAAGWVFSNWTIGGDAAAQILDTNSASSVLIYSGNNAITVKARFKRPNVNLSVVSTNSTGLTIGNPVPGSSTHAWGTVINASVTSPFIYGVNNDERGICTGYIRVGSQNAVNTAGNVSTTFTITNDTSLTWTWREEYLVKVNVAGNGSVNLTPARPGNWYRRGETVQFKATASGGHVFTGWSGDLAGPAATTNVVISAPMEVTANFGPPGDVTLTVKSSDSTGSVVGNPRVNGVSFVGGPVPRVYNEMIRGQVDDSQVLGAAANRRVINPKFTGTGSAPGSGGSDTGIFPITQNTIVTWTWDEQVLLEVEVVGDGAVQRQPGGTPSADGRGYWYNVGTVVQLRAVDAGTDTFLRWGGDAAGVNRNIAVTMDQPKLVQAVFGAKAADSDNDGMPDTWEELFGLDPDVATGDSGWNGDPDNDGVGNGQEYIISTTWTNTLFAASPIDADSDNDGMDDGYEFYHMLNMDNTNGIPGDQLNGRAVVTANGIYGRNGNPDGDMLWDTLTGYETVVGLRNIDEYFGPDGVAPATWAPVMIPGIKLPVLRYTPNPLDSGDQSFSDVKDSEIIGAAVTGDGFDDGFEYSWDQWQRRHAGDPAGDPRDNRVPELFGNAAAPSSIAVGDWDGDGNLDCAVANKGRDEVTVFPGTGNGAFAAGSQALKVGAQPTMVRAADLDGDGDLDLYTANSATNSVSVIINAGGTFLDAVTCPFGAYVPGQVNASAVAVGDFTGDGVLDIAVTHQAVNSLYVLDGSGSYAVAQTIGVGSEPSYVTVGSIWGSSTTQRYDVVVANTGDDNVTLLQQNGTGLNVIGTVSVGVEPVCVTLGDYDNDLVNDMAVVCRGDDDVRSFKGNGVGGFALIGIAPTGMGPVHMAEGQLNSVSPIPNLEEDLAVCDADQQTLSIRLGDVVDASFTQGPTIDLGGTPSWVAVGDFNRDGLDDLLVALSDTDSIRVFVGVGNGNFNDVAVFSSTLVTVDRRFNPGRVHPPPPDNGRADYDLIYDPVTGSAGSWLTDEIEYNAWNWTTPILRREFPNRRRCSHPFLWDADADRMPDGWEMAFGYDPWDSNTDDDALTDDLENPDGDWFAQMGTGAAAIKHHDVYLATNYNPNTAYGWTQPVRAAGPFTVVFNNWEEMVGTNGVPAIIANDPNDGATHPFRLDTDGDGIWDGWEWYVGLNPRDATDARLDPDDDGLTTYEEFFSLNTSTNVYANRFFVPGWQNKTHPTDPFDWDTDWDQMSDGGERGAFNFTGGLGTPVSKIDPKTSEILYVHYVGGGLNPTTVDTDGDHIPDAWETEYAGQTDPATGAVTGGMDGTQDDRFGDPDGDGLQNYQEYFAGAVYHWQFWYNNGATAWTPGRGLYNYEPYDFFNERLSSGGQWNVGPGGRKPKYWDPYAIIGPPYHPVPFKFVTAAEHLNGLWFSSTDPRSTDTDGDDMDDYWETFHGLNPLFGTVDIVASKVLGTVISVPTILPHFIWFSDPDLHKYPWIAGHLFLDPDQDEFPNIFESIQPNVQTPEYYHTDPSPMWITDTSSDQSWVNLYYWVGSVFGNPDDPHWFWDERVLALLDTYPSYAYTFEINEGFDTDNDFISDRAEGVSDPSSPGSTDMQDGQMPIKRRAMKLSGDAACRTLTSYTHAPAEFREFTIEAWVRPTNPKKGVDQIVMERGAWVPAGNPLGAPEGFRANFRLGIDAVGRPFVGYHGAGMNYIFQEVRAPATSALASNTWHHLAGTYSGTYHTDGHWHGMLYLYKNGQMVGSLPTSEIPFNGWMGGSTTGYISGMPITVGAGDISQNGWVNGSPILVGPLMGLTHAPPQLHSFYEGWVDQVMVWDRARPVAEIRQTMTRRYRRPEIATLTTYGTPPGMTNSTPCAVRYAFAFDDMADPDSHPIAPDGFDLLNGRPAVYGAAPWWGTAPDRSKVYSDYRYVPWIENLAGHAAVDPPRDSAIRHASGGNRFPNQTNPYTFIYFTASAFSGESHPHAVVQPTSTAPARYIDMLPLRWAEADENVPMWDTAGFQTGMAFFDTDGDGLPDSWEERFGLDPLSTNGVHGATGDPDEDGLTNLEEFLSNLNPFNSDTLGTGYGDGLGDTDNDGLSNADELHIFETKPYDPDSDDDGYLDGVEVRNTLPATPDNYGVVNAMTAPAYSLSPRINRSLIMQGSDLIAPFSERFAFRVRGPVVGGPTVNITAPADGSTSAQRFVTVTGTVTGDQPIASVRLYNNNRFVMNLTLSGNAFNATIIIGVGANVLKVVAIDIDGLTGTDEITVNGNFPLADIRVTQTWDVPGDLDTWLVDPLGRHMGYTAGGPGFPTNSAGQIPGCDLDIDDITGTGPENITVEQGNATNGNYEVWVDNYSHANNPNSTIRVLVKEGTPQMQYVEFGPQAMPTRDFNGTNPDAWWHVTTVSWPSGNMNPPGRPIQGAPGDEEDPATGIASQPGWTVEAWVKPMDALQTGAICRYAHPNGDMLFEIGLYENRPFGRIRASSGGIYQVDSRPLRAGEWTHIAVVYSLSEHSLRMHIDGMLVDAQLMPETRNDGDGILHVDTTWIPPGQEISRRFTACYVDEMRFWDRARNGGLIAANMHRVVYNTPSLVGVYRFDDGGRGIEDGTRTLDRAYDLGNPPDLLVNAAPGPDGIWGTADDVSVRNGRDGHNDLVTAAEYALIFGDVDLDKDGLPTWWEEFHFGVGAPGSETTWGAADDPDADGLNNLYEYLVGGNPMDQDADDDGVLDRHEDPDGDGVPSGEEQLANSHPYLADTDDDGLTDAEEAEQGFDPCNSQSPWVDRVLKVDGSPESYVRLPKEPRFLMDSWTIEAWIKPMTCTQPGTIVSYEVGEGIENYYLGINTAQQIVFRFSAADRIGRVEIKTPALGADSNVRDIVPLKSWSHVAASFNRATGLMSLFVDGSLVAARMTGRRPAVDAEGPVFGAIGKGFDGMIDEVRLSSFPMTGWTYEPTNMPASSIVADYAFDDGTSFDGTPETGTSGAHWIRHGQVEDHAPAVAADWWNLWIHAGTLHGNAQMIPAPPDTPIQNSRVDTDLDNLPDWWETEYFNSLAVASTNNSPTGYTDSDQDGLNDYYEFMLKLNPTLFDSDGDGIKDSNEDPDGDGLPNGEEQLWRTDPLNADTDDDGVTDFQEVKAAGLPTSPRYSMSGGKPRSLKLDLVPREGLSLPAEQRFDVMRYLAVLEKEATSTNATGGGTGVVVDDPDVPQGTTDGPVIGWAVEGWFKTSVDGQSGEVISHKIAGLSQFELGMANGQPYARFHDKFGSAYTLTDPDHVPLRRWTHLAAVWDPTKRTFTLFVDGTKGIRREFDASVAPVAGVGDVFIGASSAGWQQAWVDEVRVWDRLRTQDQIDRARRARVQAASRGLVAEYRFDDGGVAIEDFAHPYPMADAGSFGVYSSDYGVGLTGGTANWVDDTQFVTMIGFDDRDGDKLPNWWEDLYGFDPLLEDSNADEVLDGDEDPDNDGLNNRYEFLGQTRPDHPRTYGGLDTGEDRPDGDGVKNLFEQVYGSDPRYADTDEDGISDKDEIMGNPLRLVDFWPVSDPASPYDPVRRRGLVLDGKSRIVVPPQAKYALRQWTVEAYVRPDSDHAGNAVVFRRAVDRIGQPDEKLNYEIGLVDDGGALRPYIQFGPRNKPIRAYNPSAEAKRGAWTHIGATLNLDPHEMTLYVNGMPVAVTGADKLVGEEPPIMGASIGEVTIGGATDSKGAPAMALKGAVDEVRVWSQINGAEMVYNNYRVIVEPNAVVAALQAPDPEDDGGGGGGAVPFKITPTNDANALLKGLIGDNPIPSGITDMTVSYIGLGASAVASGLFEGFPLLPTTSPLKDGIIIASGAAADALGPNSSASITTALGTPGDADLAALVGSPPNQSLDAIGIILTFKSDASVEDLSFDMCFGSDEFPEWVNSAFNDAFGAFLDGVNITFDDNGNPLSVNNNFFQLDNDPWHPTDPDTIGKLPVNVNCEYDGLTPVLRTTWALSEGDHVLKLVISDFGDQILDSGIFLSNLDFGGTLVVEKGDLIAYFRMDDGGASLQDHAETDMRWGIDVAAAPIPLLQSGVRHSSAAGDFAELLGDTDGDGMADWWEQAYKLNRFKPEDGIEDPDGDDLDNRTEFLAGTNPLRRDSDFDAVTDDDADPDGDGLKTWREMLMGSSGGTWLFPEMADTDDDGVNDGAEAAAGTLPGDSLSPFVNRALDVGGTPASFAAMPNQPRFHQAGSWTIEAWIYPRNGNGVILQRQARTQDGVEAVNYELGMAGGRVYARYKDYYGYERRIESQGLQGGGFMRWRHVAAVYDVETGAFRLYVNGVLDRTTVDGGAKPGAVAVGVLDTVMGRGFNGLIDEVRIWNYPLEQAELNAYNNGQLSGAEDGLVAYYRFDDGGLWAEDFVATSAEDWRSRWFNAARLMGGAAMVAAPDRAIEGYGADGDSDGLPDWWEIRYFAGLGVVDGETDYDADGLTDAYEFLAGLNPLQPSTFADDVADSQRDSDKDGLVNVYEQERGTLPNAMDTDDDGLSDREEITKVNDSRTPEIPLRLSNPLRSMDPPRQRSLHLDGTGRMVADSQDTQALGTWTIAAWVMPDAGSDGGVVMRRVVQDLRNGSEAVNYELGVKALGGALRPYTRYVGLTNGAPYEVLIDGTAGRGITGDRLEEMVVEPGAWTHLAASYDPTQRRLDLYVNGRLAAYRIDAIELPLVGAGDLMEIASELTIGGGSLDSAGAVRDGFEGYIDDARISAGFASEDSVQNDAAGYNALEKAVKFAAPPANQNQPAPLTPAQATALPHRGGELLVRFKTGVNAAEAVSVADQLGARVARTHTLVPVHRVAITDGSSVADKLAAFRADPRVLYAEPNYRLQALGVPNDSGFDQLWGMHNLGQGGGTEDADIDAPEAWDRNTGSKNIVVAVIDTGVDYTHPDLAANMWTNPGETPANGVDDDGNGLVDDVYGCDYVNNDGDPMDDQSHGSHCAGTIGGVGNNGIGVAGVNWKVSIMACKFLDASGGGLTDDAISCIEYAVKMGAKLTSNSWGGGGYSAALYDAIKAAGDANQLFVAAAGNAGSDNDTNPAYPASYDLPNIIAVAATDRNDQKANFSNWGLTSVDLAAPGVDIYSTIPGGGYDLKSGTSMATPHVAGACALLLASQPGLTFEAAKEIVLGGVDKIPAMDGLCVTGGRLNIGTIIKASLGGGALVAYFTFDDGGLTAEDFTVAQDWKNNWAHAGRLQGGAAFSADAFVSLDADSDGDALPDWWENAMGLDPADAGGDNGADGDPDADGVRNLYEYLARGTNGCFAPFGHSPLLANTDSDSKSDFYEDPDGDTIVTGNEQLLYRTNPGEADTDDDGLNDGDELRAGSDPRDSLSPYVARAVRFDGGAGADNLVVVSDKIKGVYTDRFSVPVWTVEATVNPKRLAGAGKAQAFVSHRSEVSGRVNYELGMTNGMPYVRFDEAEDGRPIVVVSGASLATNDWTHLAGRLTADGELALFINGEMASRRRVGSKCAMGEGDLIIGSPGFQGRLINVRVWKIAQSDAEIRGISTHSLFFGSVSALAGYLRVAGGGHLKESATTPGPGGANPIDHLLNEWTLECWVRATSDGIVMARRNVSGATDEDFNYCLGIENGTLVGRFSMQLAAEEETFLAGSVNHDLNIIRGEIVVSDGAWHHVAYKRDATSCSLYVDGMLDAKQDRILVPNGLPTDWVVRHFEGPVVVGDGLRGDIDEVRIWDRGLPIDELKAVSKLNLSGAERGLISYFNFDYQLGRTADERSDMRNPVDEYGVYVGDAIRVAGVTDGPPLAYDPLLPFRDVALAAYFAGIDGGDTVEDFMNRMGRDPFESENYAGRMGATVRFEVLSGLDWPDGPDSDLDGMPDVWESYYGMNPGTGDGDDGPYGDPDHDGLINLYEYLALRDFGVWLNPFAFGTLTRDTVSDFDSRPPDPADPSRLFALTFGEYFDDTDQIPDGIEAIWPQFMSRLYYNRNDDPDEDGWNNQEEYLAGTSPVSALSKPRPSLNGVLKYSGTKPGDYRVLAYAAESMDRGAVACDVAVQPDGTITFSTTNAPGARVWLFAWKGDPVFKPSDPHGMPQHQPIVMWWGSANDIEIGLTDPEQMPWFQPFSWTAPAGAAAVYVRLTRMGGTSPTIMTAWVHNDRNWFHRQDYLRAKWLDGGNYAYGLSPATYKWQVASNDQAAAGSIVAEGLFNVPNNAAPQASLVGPVNGDILRHARHSFRWNLPPTGKAPRFEFQIWPANNSFTWSTNVVAPWRDKNGVYALSLPLPTPKDGLFGSGIWQNGDYRWRVRAWNNGVAGSWPASNGVFRVGIEPPPPSGAGAPSLAGEIIYHGRVTARNIIVRAYRATGDRARIEGQAVLTAPGAFSILGLDNYSYVAMAFIDLNGNDIADEWEPQGFARDKSFGHHYEYRADAYGFGTFDLGRANRNDDVRILVRDRDTDNDDLPDGWEYQNLHGSPNTLHYTGTDDNDGDGVLNRDEYGFGSNPMVRDSDGDGLDDGVEVRVYRSSPASVDSDGDGLSDGAEVAMGLKPANADDDGDGVPTSIEVTWDGVAAYNAATDLNPGRFDTDGDGVGDLMEMAAGSDPRNPADAAEVGIRGFGRDAQGRAVVTWPVRRNRKAMGILYEAQQSTNLEDWTVVGELSTDGNTDGSASVTVPDGQSGTSGFYRLRLRARQ